MDENTLSPLQDNTDQLVDSGLLDRKTAELINAKNKQPIAPPSTPENQLATPTQEEKNLESMKYSYGAAEGMGNDTQPVELSQMADSYGADQEDVQILQKAEQLKQEVEESQPIVETAEEIVADSAQKMQKAEEIKDFVDIKNQADANKEMLKQDIAAEEAVQAVAAEKQQSELDEIKAIESDIEREREELKNISAEGLFQDMTTGNKILAAISIALAGMGSGLTGSGRNAALDILNKRVDGIMEQKQLSIKDKLAKKQRIFDIMDQNLKKQEAATNDQLKKMQIQKMQNDISVQKQQMYQQQMAARQKEYLERKLTSGQGLSQQEEAAYIESLSKEDRKRYIPGFGRAKDAEIAKEVSKALYNGEQIQDQVNKIRGLLEEYGGTEFFNRGAVSQEESARRGIQLQLKELMGLGVLNGPDLDLLNEYTGKDFFSPLTTMASKQAKLKEVEDYVKSGINSKLRASGLPTVGKTKREAYIEKMIENGVSKEQAEKLYRKNLKNQ